MNSEMVVPSDRPFPIQPRLAILGSFALFLIIFLFDCLSPNTYRFVLLYLFPLTIVALNANSLSLVVVTTILAIFLESFFTLVEHPSLVSFTYVDIVNLLTRVIATLLIVWLARALRRSQLRVNLLANTDFLTGLPNARSARIALERLVAIPATEHRYFSVGLIDIDHFKRVNDEMGHLAGDAVLVQLAQIFFTQATPDIQFFRLGGDEFLLLMQQKNNEQAQHICRHLQDLVSNALITNSQPMSLSIGLATYDTPPQSVSNVLNEVDARMYNQKTASNAYSIS